MKAFGPVFITSEKKLPPGLEKYRLAIKPSQIHDLMAYASLVYGESATMSSEAAILGVHSIFCDVCGRGYTDEEERRYGLVSNFRLDADSQSRSGGENIRASFFTGFKISGTAETTEAARRENRRDRIYPERSSFPDGTGLKFMCGICGIYSLAGISPKDIDGVLAMNEIQKHRGPDDYGIWNDSHCVLGHRRLSIIDLSSNGHQPFLSDDIGIV